MEGVFSLVFVAFGGKVGARDGNPSSPMHNGLGGTAMTKSKIAQHAKAGQGITMTEDQLREAMIASAKKGGIYKPAVPQKNIHSEAAKKVHAKAQDARRNLIPNTWTGTNELATLFGMDENSTYHWLFNQSKKGLVKTRKVLENGRYRRYWRAV